MSQEIQEIAIEDLVLWTENPRDPIDKNASDQDVVDNSLDDKLSKWTLSKLAKEMRGYYDYSELPTVVYHGEKPVVYDGNRRMILAKIKHGCVKVEGSEKITLPEFPYKIPCNVCSKEIAIQNVFRKHGDSGSWSPLDRDIFINKFLKQPKSIFLKLEESTGIIGSNPHLNQGFVKKEIFTEEKLNELGFEINGDDILSKHTKKESELLLNNISSQIALKNLSTRNSRGNVIGVLDKASRDILEKNKSNVAKKQSLKIASQAVNNSKRKTRRSKGKSPEFFGGVLYLKAGKVSDLYRDIVDLHSFYVDNKGILSKYFPSFLRMSLRLLCEAASVDNKQNMQDYLNTHFPKAKKVLSADAKTTLSTQNVKDSSITQLLHVGAHNYHAANNLDQTIALSIIIGGILHISHGK